LPTDEFERQSGGQALLVAEFESHRSASQEFPIRITPAVIRSAIDSFRNSLAAQTERGVCSSCGVFCSLAEIETLGDGEDCLNQLKQVGLDRCGYEDGSWSFCKPCHADILRGKIPKFSALNHVNVIKCDDHPVALQDLTVVEECVLARRHPIGAILKLRPGNRRGPANYYALRGHMVVIPQDPGPLLDILPSPNLRFQDGIKVFWVGKCQPCTEDLKPFLQIRREKVLTALQWLVAHNSQYRDLTINHGLLSSWPEEFIPSQITANISYIDRPDHTEREGYVANLETDNFENDMQAALNDPLSEPDANFASGSLYTDVNGERVHCDMRLLNTLTSLVDKGESDVVDEDAEVDMDELVEDDDSSDTDLEIETHGTDNDRSSEQGSNYISYGIRSDRSVLSNVWEDPLYFTSAFPTLFPTGTGGHLDERAVKVSLEAFGKWALKHHSRR
jgi:hypothetical protein